MKKTRNIFIVLAVGIYRFFKVSISSVFSLFFFKKNHTIKEEKFPFLQEMVEIWPEKFWKFPTAIRLGRAIFAPILFFISQKNDKNPK